MVAMRRCFLFLGALLSLCCASPVLLAQGLTTDAQHYQLEIELNFANHTIVGKNTATFESLVSGLTTIDLDLTSALTVGAVRMSGVPVSFTRPTDLLHVTLDRAYQVSEVFTIEIEYSGAPPTSSGFGGLVFTTHSGAEMVWTLSEPWDAKTWWPGKDVLVDKATFDIWITHPDTMTAVSNGALLGVDTLSGNRLRSRWQESHQMAAYLASMAVTNYTRRTDTYTHLGANMPVEFYVFPESWSSWQSGMNLIVPMLTAYSDAYGQYPWTDEKYGIAQFNWGGGMEHQTVASQVNVTEWLSAHELAHQWWGDLITCATWHDIWLNEGFATFSEALWYERKPGGTMAAYFSRMQANKPRSTSGTVYVYNATNVNEVFSGTNVYDKGAWVVHMLRGFLGDTLFFQCLHDYRQAYAESSATTDDFRAVCEQTSGRDLANFFDQWVMNGGSPTYRYGWRAQSAGGHDNLYLELDQTQSGRSVFEMPVRVRVQTALGTEEHVVWNDERQDQFALPLQAPATSVQIDPDEWILRTSSPASQSFTTPFFAASPEEFDTVQGGSVTFHVDQGASAANRPFLMVVGLSGSQPGVNVFGLQIPVNYDVATEVALGAINTPTFANFYSTLDASGRGVAQMNLPAGLAVPAQGMNLTVAYLMVDQFDFASRPVSVRFR